MSRYRENCDYKINEFLERCFYHSGQYSSEEHFAELDNKLMEKEVHNLIYLYCFRRSSVH